MNVRDLIPWNRSSRVPSQHAEDGNPLLPLRYEVNRLFDDAFRGFDLAPFGFDRVFNAVRPGRISR